MIDNHDKSLLEIIQDLVSDFDINRAGEIGDLLLNIRDQLNFNDDVWYHQLTQLIVTLDSVSTFSPVNEKQAKYVKDLLNKTMTDILNLINQKDV